MTRKSPQTLAKTTTPPRGRSARQSLTFELVARLAPHQGLIDNLVRTFALDPVDYDGIRRDRRAHRRDRQGVRDGAERESPADPPATDHRRLRQLRLRGRAVLRHQEVGCGGTHQQVAQR